MAIAYGGGYNGGMMGGSVGDHGLSDPVGVLATIKGLFSFLPNWMATLVTALLLLFTAVAVGWIVGKIVGGILYPNPDKQSILNKQQKFACLGAAVLLFGLTIFALTYQPKPKTEPAGSMPVGGEVLPGAEGGEMVDSGAVSGEADDLDAGTDAGGEVEVEDSAEAAADDTEADDTAVAVPTPREAAPEVKANPDIG